MAIIKMKVPTLEQSVSIHPRVVKGRTVHPKVNTAKPTSRTTKAEKNLQRRRADFDTMKGRLAPQDALAYKRPGSMKK